MSAPAPFLLRPDARVPSGTDDRARNRIQGCALAFSDAAISLLVGNLPERAGGTRRALDQFTSYGLLGLEQGRKGGIFGPTSGLFLEIERLVGDFLSGLDVPGGRLLQPFQAEDRFAHFGKALKNALFVFCHSFTSRLLPCFGLYFRCFSFLVAKLLSELPSPR